MANSESWGIMMGMAVIRIPAEEAARDFAGIIARVSAGEEVIIERGNAPAVVMRVSNPHLRLLSESLRLAEEHSSTATLDGEFGRDLEAVVNSHSEPLQTPWE